MLLIGIPFLSIGEMKWVGDTFKASNSVQGVVLSGFLRTDAQGRVLGITYDADETSPRSRKSQRFRHEIEYNYQTQLEIPFFPSRIRSSAILNGGRRVLVEEREVLRITPSEKLLGREQFDFSPYLTASSRTFFVSNQSLVYTNYSAPQKLDRWFRW